MQFNLVWILAEFLLTQGFSLGMPIHHNPALAGVLLHLDKEHFTNKLRTWHVQHIDLQYKSATQVKHDSSNTAGYIKSL